MTAEEIRAIANGKLGAYLSQFLSFEEAKAYNFEVDDMDSGGQILTKKVPYKPDTDSLMPNEVAPFAIV